MKKLILTTTAALVALLLTGSAIYAQTDDWMKGVLPPGFIAIADCSTSKREVSSSAQNNHAVANFTICWEGTDVWISPSTSDRQPGDGRGAVAQISYLVLIGGKWRQHERIAAFDRTPNGKFVTPGWSMARYPTKDLLVRACLSKPNKRNTVDETTCDRYR